ncbi:hypothetical protein LIER_23509 [Lithospermum erythrorhizon]|uniref:F-box domain-containing protein n=1 Tax=Lithospermum erythrorhizon TaxID=34254 RepID=A0AAV3R0Y2_LITER
MESAKTIQYIPEEIIIQILQRLTVLSLLKFRCVCKLWFSLISWSKFKKTHLNHSKNSQNYANYHLILSPNQYSNPSFSCSLSSIFDKTAPFNLKPLNMQDSGVSRMRIFGHCNGLLCVSVNAELLLYNPSTRKSKKLPASVNDLKTYGLCYNESIDDYKVVELMNPCRQYFIKVDGGVSIFSLRTQSWMKRIIGGCFRDISTGLPIGGVLHWKNYSARQIVTVDTLTCTYATLERPNFDVLPGLLFWDVMEFGGGLGVYRHAFRTSVEIWTMNTSSWTKVLFIPYRGSPGGTRFPLLGLKDAHILFYNRRGRLMVYNSRENSYVYRRIPNDTRELNVNRFVPSPVYIESLIEPSFDQE